MTREEPGGAAPKCRVVAVADGRVTYTRTVTLSLEQFAMWADEEVQ